jgi:hypothetical protein
VKPCTRIAAKSVEEALSECSDMIHGHRNFHGKAPVWPFIAKLSDDTMYLESEDAFDAVNDAFDLLRAEAWEKERAFASKVLDAMRRRLGASMGALAKLRSVVEQVEDLDMGELDDLDDNLWADLISEASEP